MLKKIDEMSLEELRHEERLLFDLLEETESNDTIDTFKYFDLNYLDAKSRYFDIMEKIFNKNIFGQNLIF